MNERNLYRGLSNFAGSIDEDGNLYDERHHRVGRIEGNDVYYYCCKSPRRNMRILVIY